jgi:hypothetical protein
VIRLLPIACCHVVAAWLFNVRSSDLPYIPGEQREAGCTTAVASCLLPCGSGAAVQLVWQRRFIQPC